MTVLIVTAVEAEAAAVRAAVGDDVAVYPVGVGPAAAAAGTARLLATGSYDAVICAGVAGGFAGRAEVGSVVVATSSIAADLGAQTPDGFVPIDTLGFGTAVLPAHEILRPAGAVLGPVLSVSTVTGTAASAAELLRRYPEAVAEAMEGFGVATAAGQAGVRFAEVRTISNLVGPRDRSAWRLREAFDALTAAFKELT